MTVFTLDHLFVEGRCHSRPTLLRAQSLETSMQFLRSCGEDNLAKTAMMSSAGNREMGEMRFCSSMARRRAASSRSGEMEGAREERESLDCSMAQSLSSSKARSGEVEADESEREVLAPLARRRARDMFGGLEGAPRGRAGGLACESMAREAVQGVEGSASAGGTRTRTRRTSRGAAGGRAGGRSQGLAYGVGGDMTMGGAANNNDSTETAGAVQTERASSGWGIPRTGGG